VTTPVPHPAAKATRRPERRVAVDAESAGKREDDSLRAVVAFSKQREGDVGVGLHGRDLQVVADEN
jgi:hypothetical protein